MGGADWPAISKSGCCCCAQAADIAEAGFTAVWFPPPSDSVSPQVRAAAAAAAARRTPSGRTEIETSTSAACIAPPHPRAPPCRHLAIHAASSPALPPPFFLPSTFLSTQGYLPRDLYDLNSKFGSEAELRDAIAVFHEQVGGRGVGADVHACLLWGASAGA